jgi:hypothetical protein
VLYSPQLCDPEQPTVMLSQIVFNGFELLNTAAGDGGADGGGGQWLEDDSAPFLVVFQYGRSVWAGFPETRVRSPIWLDFYASLTSRVCVSRALESNIRICSVCLVGVPEDALMVNACIARCI